MSPNNIAKAKILVIECYRHTLAVMHSLKTAGFRVVLGVSPDDDDYTYLKYSNAVDELWLHPSMESAAEVFIESLSKKIEIENIDAVYPVGEISLRLLNQHWFQLTQKVSVIACAPDLSELCLDKTRLSTKVTALDIAAPEAEFVDDWQSAEAFIAAHPGAIAIKPNDSEYLIKDEKCLRLDFDEELKQKLTNNDVERGLILQQWIEGNRHNCMFIADQGEIVSYFESEVLSATGTRGTGYSVYDRSIAPNVKRRKICQKLLQNLQYSGIGCIQFLVEKSGDQSWFLELNPRSDATMALPVACKMALPAHAAQLALGLPLTVTGYYRVGVYRHWLIGDVENLQKYLKLHNQPIQKLKQCIQLCHRILRPTVGTIFSLFDPMPGMYLFFQLLKRKIAKGWQRIVKNQ